MPNEIDDVWTHRLDRIKSIAIILSPFLIALVGLFNWNKTGSVEQKVDDKATQVIQNQEDAKNERQETAAELKKRLEAQLKIEEEREMREGSQLYTNWKYLEDLGETVKAAEAKKLYDAFRAKHNKKD